ncbi:MAG: 4-alpha-glucanotransferase [Thermodesulfovibrionales bacterium]|nr:4-alpha-glucanotransferase [Thermodesulfovibrionales bacterium]
MKSRNELIDELASLCGIVFEYWDFLGIKHVTSQETKEAILKAMKFKIDTAEDILTEIIKIYDKPWLSMIEPVKVISQHDQPFRIPIHIPVEESKENSISISCLIENEQHETEVLNFYSESINILEQKWINGVRYIKLEIFDRISREIGYYNITIKCFIDSKEILGRFKLIIAPDSCYLPEYFEKENKKLWGITCNLYSIKSKRNWGCGDFTDLKVLTKWLSDLGGDFIALNPLHATLNLAPYDISPYSPTSRLFKNFIYLDILSVPDILESEEAQALIQEDTFKEELKKITTNDLIDYTSLAQLKENLLRTTFKNFYKNHFINSSVRGQAFQSYIEKEGTPLLYFALYQSIYNDIKINDWRQWDLEKQKPTDDNFKNLVEQYNDEILYHSYVQWLIDEEIKKISNTLKKTMLIGLIFDLAIGSTITGSDVWHYQDIFALNMNVGAPPDDFNPTGQDWGFPPLIPHLLKENQYELFIQTIRKTMKNAGAIRIDHALGLFRLFWIPQGKLPAEGAYVSYPSSDLLRIIALESIRNKTFVIAEDLGTVGENVYDRLQDFNMLSYKILYFERNYPDPSFKPPWAYPQKALCAVTTHDLATCRGFWLAKDIEVKKELGLYLNEERYIKHLNDRYRDKELLLKALYEQNILSDNYVELLQQIDMPKELCLAIYEYLAKAPCFLVSVSLDDILGTINQQNLPGIVEGYPCWRQKTPISLEEITSSEYFISYGQMFKRNGR